MARLEDLTPGARVTGILPTGWVEVLSASWLGSAVALDYRDAAGRPDRVLIYRDSEPRLSLLPPSPNWTFAANGEIHNLAMEAYRIRLAGGFGPPAVSAEVGSSGAVEEVDIRRWLIQEETEQLRQAAVAEGGEPGSRLAVIDVEAFFVEAVNLLDGRIAVREPGRYEITNFPATLADVGGSPELGPQLLSRYGYITFLKPLYPSPIGPMQN